MSTRTLGKLYSRFLAKSNRLITQYDVSMPLKHIHESACEGILCDSQTYGVVRLQFLWGQFCKELVIKSAVGGYRTVGGVILNPGTAVNSPQSIDSIVSSELRKRMLRFPVWHSPPFVAAIGRALGIQNYTQINLTLSQPAPVKEITDIRNFIIHPSMITKAKYVKIARGFNLPYARPFELMINKLPGGITQFADWVASLQQMAENAVR